MRVLILFLFILSNLNYAQLSIKEIDFLMNEKNSELRSEHKFEEIITISNNVIKEAKKTNYIKGEIYGYVRLGNALCNLTRYQESLSALNYANVLLEDNLKEDYAIRSSVHLGLGRCYLESRASYQNSVFELNLADGYAQKIKDVKEKNEMLQLIYSNQYAVYTQMEKYHDAAVYLKRCLKIREDNAFVLAGLARYHNFTTHNLDSARYYLEKADKTNPKIFDRNLLYNQWGKYYLNKKDYPNAIAYYKKSEKLAKEINEWSLLESAINGLNVIYKIVGDKEQALKYSNKRINLKDSMSWIQAKNSEIAIRDLVKKKENVLIQESSEKRFAYIMVAVILCLILIIFGLKIYKNRNEKESLLKLIEKHEEENKDLKIKVNDSFEDVVQLAKDNSPEFMTRFQEVYSEYYQKLTSIEPKLLSTELKLCAMVYLGFSSKDIAEYTFVTLKAAQHRKFRLRKKLNIPSDVDINLWLAEYNK